MFNSTKEFAHAMLEGRRFKNGLQGHTREHYIYSFGVKGFIATDKEGNLFEMHEYDWSRYKYVAEVFTPIILWYGNIPENGVLCWVHHSNPNAKARVDLITYFDREGSGMFGTPFSDWEYATPLTKEEVSQYIL